jgi:hypothetical protein
LADWEPVDNPAAGQTNAPATAAPASQAITSFPRSIHIERLHDDYTLDMQATKMTVNGEIPPDGFKLEQPAGSELVRVGDSAEIKPATEGKPQ